MAASNFRIHGYETTHHLMSRIAHKVYILNDEDRNDLIDIVRRSAEFTGIKLIGWCIMTNHFHLLVHLPQPIEVDETEVLRRYGVLKGIAAAHSAEKQLSEWRASGAPEEADAWLDRQRRRMYDVGEFMKIVKQWFTEEYNRRYSHVGTLWEGEYVSKVVKRTTAEMAKRLGYIHLNPINAAITIRFDDYVWSSFTAFKNGDPVAIDGMRFIYGYDLSLHEMYSVHMELLEKQLDGMKRQRAEEIARRRAAGQSAPCDALTNEALVIQAEAHLEEVRNAHTVENGSNLFSTGEGAILRCIELNPHIEAADIVSEIGLSKSMVYKCLNKLKTIGILERPDRRKAWIVNHCGKQV